MIIIISHTFNIIILFCPGEKVAEWSMALNKYNHCFDDDFPQSSSTDSVINNKWSEKLRYVYTNHILLSYTLLFKTCHPLYYYQYSIKGKAWLDIYNTCSWASKLQIWIVQNTILLGSPHPNQVFSIWTCFTFSHISTNWPLHYWNHGLKWPLAN